MEQAIRQLLSNAEKDEDSRVLTDAFEKLKQGRRDGSNQVDPFSSDLYIICAQLAIKLNRPEVATNCTKLYFQKTPPNNEYLCHAYLCQAQLHAPFDSKEIEKLEQCVGYVLKAINFAKSNGRYYYLVYNASVLYWSFVRPFVKPNARHLIVRSFQAVVKSLEEVDDDDYEWRAELLLALLECLIDAGKKDEAQALSVTAFDFTKSYVPHMCKQVLALQVKYKILESTKILNNIKSITELSLYYQMLKLNGSEASTVLNEATSIFNAICVDNNADVQDTLLRRGSTLHPLLAQERNTLLLELTRICFQLECTDIADKCVTYLSNSRVNTNVSLQASFLKCELKIRKLKEKESFTKHSIDTRLQAIGNLEEHLVSAKRFGEESVIQIGCVAMWNLCLPLLQTNLRKNVGAHLALAVEMLDEIGSLLLSLRCQLHFEVAKCEEEKEQLQSAILHLAKALELDDVGSYKAQITHKLERLKLKAVLYQTPARAEDHAAMIIEQAESAKDTSTPAMMREYLMKVGILLAPDAFHLAMEAEEALPMAKVGQSSVKKLAEKVAKYEAGIAKLQGHVERLENTNDKERVMLWADLVKTARRQKVWDVTRVAAMFCLLYDNNRWTVIKAQDQSPSKSVDSKDTKTSVYSQPLSSVVSSIEFGVISKEHLDGEAKFHENEDFLRLFAEINFIFAEALVELLLKEGFKLLEKVKMPEETKLTPNIFHRSNVQNADTREWARYADWMEGVSKKAMAGFLRSSNIGVELNQAWIVCNAGIYVWNYAHHLLVDGCYTTLKPYLHPLYKAIKMCGHSDQTVFLCDIAHAVAQGFMQPYIPEDFYKAVKRIEIGQRGGASSPTKGRSTKLSNKNIANKVTDASATATETMLTGFKEAVDILEYALVVTAGSTPQDIVPMDVRYPLIKALVLCKGLTNQQLPKNYGHDSDDKKSQGPMSRALFVLEALLLQTKGVVDFPQCPPIADVIKMVQNAIWTDNVILLQVWSQLSVLSFHLDDISTSIYCSDMALASNTSKASHSKKCAKRKTGINYGDNYSVEQEMLYYASVIKGQCLAVTMNGRLETRRLALNCFVDACKNGSLAGKYDLVMTSARHFWNIIHPLITSPLERQVLKKPIKQVLKFIQDVAKHHKNMDEDEQKDDGKPIKQKTRDNITKPKSKQKVKKSESKVSSVPSSVKTEDVKIVDSKTATFDDDLKLRAALYGVLFQAYADKGELTEGIRAMDDAIKVMPRTHHRLLIFKHRVMTNAKLNKPIQFDMGKFCDESESLLAQMWQRVAKNSIKQKDQMCGYINAIQALTEERNLFQKVDYLGEFGEWLFVNEFNISEAVDQLMYAVSLLIGGDDSGIGMSSISITKDASVLESIKTIKTMDILVRLYVMIASMVGHNHTLFRQCNLAASIVVQHMWKSAITNADVAIKAGWKPGEVHLSKSKETKIGSPDHLKLDGSPSKFTASRKSATSRTFGSKSSTKSSVPLSLEAWATYTASKNIKEHFKADTSGVYLSPISITKPELSLYYLEVLCDNLCSIGFHHFAILPTMLMSYIAEDILNNSSATTLIHMRFCELYEKLAMKTPYQQHQKCIMGNGSQILSEEDQTLSREECEIWMEKKQQVQMFEENPSSASTKNNETIAAMKPLQHEVVMNTQQNGFTVLRHVWCKMADYLIQWTQYQPARLLLEEAKLSAYAFDDEVAKEIISHHNASIAHQERDWGKVMLLVESTKYQVKTQLLWMKKLFLLVDALHNFSLKSTSFQSISSNRGFQHAKKLLQDAVMMIERMHLKNKNKTHLGPYIKSKLVSKLGIISFRESQEKDRNSVEAQQNLLKDSIDYITESYCELEKLGYVMESLELMRMVVDIHMKVYVNATGDEKKEILLKSIDIAKTALNIVRNSISVITELTMMEDVGNMILPIQQEMHTSQLKLMHVMQTILNVDLEEKKRKMEKEEEKQLINRVIDNYVDIQQKVSPLQLKWNATIDLITQDVVVMCASVNSLKKQLPAFCVESSLNFGMLLNKVARYDMADELDSWFSIEQSSEPDGGTHQDYYNLQNDIAMKTSPFVHDQLDKLPFCSLNEKMRKFQRYNVFTSQAVEYLLHAIHSGLHHADNATLLTATQQLVEIVGKRDSILAVNLLALYQSVDTCNFMQKTMKQTFIDPHCSTSSASLIQNNLLKETCMAEYSSPLEAVNSLLEGYEWWKRLSISRNHLDILKEIPSHVTFVIFQHSVDKKFVYGGVMERSGLEPRVKRSTKSPTPVVRTCIERKETYDTLLNNLLEMCKDYTALVCREFMLQAKEDSENERKKVLEEDISDETELLKQTRVKTERKERISDAFDTLVTATEAYLGSLLTTIEQTLKASSVPEVVVILADSCLMELPLEALNVFHLEGIKSVGRDFSLQMFYNRCVQDGDSEKHGNQAKGAAGRRESKLAKPIEKSAAKKNGKADGGGGEKKTTSKDVENFVVDLGNLKYLVDPFNEAPQVSNTNDDVIEEVINAHRQKLSKWSGIKGIHGVANIKDMQELIESSESFLFSGFGRLLSVVPPEYIAVLNMSGCNVFISLDLVQTSEIFLRQGGHDSLKSWTRLQLENPVQTAAILSLCGVKSLAMNHWHTTVNSNNERLRYVINGLTSGLNEKAQSLGECVKSWSRTKTVPKTATEVAEEQSIEPSKKGKISKEDEVVVVIEPPVEVVEEGRLICDRFGLVLYGIPNVVVS